MIPANCVRFPLDNHLTKSNKTLSIKFLIVKDIWKEDATH